MSFGASKAEASTAFFGNSGNAEEEELQQVSTPIREDINSKSLVCPAVNTPCGPDEERSPLPRVPPSTSVSAFMKDTSQQDHGMQLSCGPPALVQAEMSPEITSNPLVAGRSTFAERRCDRSTTVAIEDHPLGTEMQPAASLLSVRGGQGKTHRIFSSSLSTSGSLSRHQDPLNELDIHVTTPTKALLPAPNQAVLGEASKTGDAGNITRPTPWPITSTSSMTDWSSRPRMGFPPTSDEFAAAAEQATLAQRCKEEHDNENRWHRLCRGVVLLASAKMVSIEQLRSAARAHGIPHHLRSVMWLTLTGMALKVDENEYFCAELLRRNGYVTGPYGTAIEMDLERTFPGHPYFSVKDVGIYKLRNVLHALCWRNPLLSYCQSFNFIAAFLLLVLDDEERVFWMMTHIMETMLPNDFYSDTLMGANVEQAVMGRLVEDRLPNVATKFHNAGLEVNALVANWVLSLFVNAFPVPTVLRVWDYLLCRSAHPAERTTAHIEITLATLKYLDDHGLLNGEGAGELLMSMRQQAASLYDASKLIRLAASFSITCAQLHELRRQLKPGVVSDLSRMESLRAAQRERRMARELRQAQKLKGDILPSMDEAAKQEKA